MPDYQELQRNYNQIMGNEIGEYPVFTLDYVHQQRLAVETYLSHLSVEEKRQKDLISIQTEETRAKIRADVAEKANYRKCTLYFTTDGRVRFNQELFGETLQDVLPFRIKKSWRLLARDKPNEPEILLIKLELEENRKEKYIFLDLDNINRSKIKKAFHREGVHLGISERKEAEILENLVSQIANSARVIEIPTVYGWFRKNGKWGYIFPGEFIWEEVKKWI